MTSTPSEYIKLRIHIDKRIDLAEFSNSLLAINSEYRSWLKDNENFSHNDRNLRLTVEKIQAGSIEIWIAQAQELLVAGPLCEFAIDYFKEFIGALILGTSVLVISKPKIDNTKKILKSRFSWHYHSKNRNFGADISLEQFNAANSNLKKLNSILEPERAEGVLVKFRGFHMDGNAKVVISKYSNKELKAVIEEPAKMYFSDIDENILKDGKFYTANIEIFRKHDNSIEAYSIKEIVGS